MEEYRIYNNDFSLSKFDEFIENFYFKLCNDFNFQYHQVTIHSEFNSHNDDINIYILIYLDEYDYMFECKFSFIPYNVVSFRALKMHIKRYFYAEINKTLERFK